MQFASLKTAGSPATLEMISLADYSGDIVAIRVAGRMRIPTSFGPRVANVADLVQTDGRGRTGLIFAGFVKTMTVGEWYAGRLTVAPPAEGEGMATWAFPLPSEKDIKALSAGCDTYVKAHGDRSAAAFKTFEDEQARRKQAQARAESKAPRK